MPLQSLVHTLMEDFALDYSALHKAFANTLEPTRHLLRRRLQSRNEALALSRLLSAAGAADDQNEGHSTFITVSPNDRTQSAYSCRTDSDDDEDGDEAPAFDDNNVNMECAPRHPGTAMEDDVEDGVDPVEKYPHFQINPQTAPITTVAAEHLYGLAFAGGGEISAELRASYPMQLSARIDEARKCLNLDCFEYKPTAVNVQAKEGEEDRPIPTYGDLKKFTDSFDVMGRNSDRSAWESDEESLDPDEDMSEVVEPREGTTFDDDDILQLSYQAVAGNFAYSRCLRVRISLDQVVGIRLIGKTAGDEADNGAVLILELSEPLDAGNAFAARKVHAKYHSENSFTVVDDWTPDRAASRSSRFYLYGNLAELRQAAGLMARLCPHLAAMLSSATDESNTLRASASVEYASAPAFNDNKEAEGKPSGKKLKVDNNSAKGYKMSVADVHQLLVDTNLVESTAGARHVNPCLKRAILMGHILIDESTTKSTVIHKATCCQCGGKGLECTLGDAMEQSTYAGLDYEDGGEGAEVKCRDCGSGNYITELCSGNGHYDSGKFHNHCCECDDFGVCIRDYRQAHCRHCGEHYFRGNVGFPCPSCGGGRAKDLTAMPPPTPSAWDGMVANAKEVFEAQLKGKDRFDAMITRAMILGPTSGEGGSNPLMSAIREMASQMDDGDDGT